MISQPVLPTPPRTAPNPDPSTQSRSFRAPLPTVWLTKWNKREQERLAKAQAEEARRAYTVHAEHSVLVHIWINVSNLVSSRVA